MFLLRFRNLAQMPRGCVVLALEFRQYLGVKCAGRYHPMRSNKFIALSAVLFAAAFSATAVAQAPAQQQPMFAEVEGTDNVYIFRYQNHHAMFIVTPAGVIVT